MSKMILNPRRIGSNEYMNNSCDSTITMKLFLSTTKKLHKYKRPINSILQKNKIERQVKYSISEMKHKSEEQHKQQQGKNNN